MGVIRLKEILVEKGISNKLLAEKVGVTPATISYINNGNQFPKEDLLVKISQALDVDIKDLFYSTKDKEPLYVMRDGKYVAIGEMNLKHLKE